VPFRRAAQGAIRGKGRRDYARAMSNEEPPPEAPREPEPRPRRRGFRTGRLEAFSDGVFAIAITLLILDIGVSATAGQDLGAAIRALWPSYLAYVASFSTIGAAWLGHNAITEYLDRADAAFVRLNLLLLLVVSFLPFPTRLVAEYIRQAKAEKVAVTFYGIVLVLATTMLLVLWRYAVRAKLVRPDLGDEEVELLTERLTPGLGAYLVLIVTGLFVPVIAVIGYLGIALYYIIPFRRLSASILPRRWHRKRVRR
jgi:uncharacterized membrane protein